MIMRGSLGFTKLSICAARSKNIEVFISSVYVFAFQDVYNLPHGLNPAIALTNNC